MTELGARPRVRDDARLLAVSAALGVLAGIAAKAGDESGWRWAADLGSDPAAWVLAVALIGRYAPTSAIAALRGAVFFAAMTVAYYGWAAWVLDMGTDRDLVVIWLVLSATAVATFSAVIWWSTRRPGPAAGALVALAAATALVGGQVHHLYLWADDALVADLVNPVQAVVEVVTVALVTLVLPRHRSTRTWAVLLVVPAVVVAGWLLDVLSGVLR